MKTKISFRTADTGLAGPTTGAQGVIALDVCNHLETGVNLLSTIGAWSTTELGRGFYDLNLPGLKIAAFISLTATRGAITTVYDGIIEEDDNLPSGYLLWPGSHTPTSVTIWDPAAAAEISLLGTRISIEVTGQEDFSIWNILYYKPSSYEPNPDDPPNNYDGLTWIVDPEEINLLPYSGFKRLYLNIVNEDPVLVSPRARIRIQAADYRVLFNLPKLGPAEGLQSFIGYAGELLGYSGTSEEVNGSNILDKANNRISRTEIDKRFAQIIAQDLVKIQNYIVSATFSKVLNGTGAIEIWSVGLRTWEWEFNPTKDPETIRVGYINDTETTFNPWVFENEAGGGALLIRTNDNTTSTTETLTLTYSNHDPLSVVVPKGISVGWYLVRRDGVLLSWENAWMPMSLSPMPDSSSVY